MMIGRLLIYTVMGAGIFAASTFSTIQIRNNIIQASKNAENQDNSNKAEEKENNDDEGEYIIELSDTDKFIQSLTNFGNMKAELDVNITYNNNEYSILGTADVSMETLDELMLAFDLNVDLGIIELPLTAAYIDNTIYLATENVKVKLLTSDINEIATIFNDLMPSDVLPTGLSLDTTTLLANIGKMEAVKGETSITYTCNLFEDFPPIIFTSDLDYNLTGIKLENLSLFGFDISAEVKTTITGKGNKVVAVPEDENNHYVDLKNYFGVAEQIKGLINEPKLDVNYDIDVYKNEEKLLTTTGLVNLDLKDQIAVNVNGQFEDNNYLISYKDNKVAVNYDDKLKLTYDLANINDLLSSINKLSANPILSGLFSKLDTIKIPLIDFIKTKDYKAILDKYHGASLFDNELTLNVSNALLSDSDSDVVIKASIKDNKLSDIIVSNLTFNEYRFDLKLNIDEYHEPSKVDYSDYIDISNAHYLINQIDEILTNKEIALDIATSINDLDISGYIQAKINDPILDSEFALDLIIKQEEKIHNVRLQYNSKTFYASYNNQKIKIDHASILEMVEATKKIIANNIVDLLPLVEKVANKLNFSSDFDLLSLIKDLPIANLNKNEETISFTILKDTLKLDNDIFLALTFNEHKLDKVNVNIADINIDLTIKEYDEEYEASKAIGGWVGSQDVSTISNVVNYASTLSNKQIHAVIDQIKALVNETKLGADYDIKVSRDNALTFQSAGSLDLSALKDIKNNQELKVSLNGSLVNLESGHNLDSKFAISYIDDTVYFSYNDSLNIAYNVNDILDLVYIIKTRLPKSDALDNVLDKLLPDGSTTKAPLFEIINNGNYEALISYFKAASITDDNALCITIDASLLGLENEEMTFTIKLDNNGISYLRVSNIYAFGYTIDISLNIRDYQDIVINQDIKYTNLEYVDDIFNDVLDLINQKQFAFDVNAKINDINLTAEAYVDATSSYDRGIGKATLNINNKDHDIIIDVTRNYDENKNTILDTSEVLFSYNSNLKGNFTFESISKTINTIKELINSDNKRLDKYKALLTADTSNSIISKVMDGDIEAILNDELIKGLEFKDNAYVITLNGNMLKLNDAVDVSDIVLSVGLDESHHLLNLTFNGNLSGYDIDLSINLKKYDPTYFTTNGLKKDSSYIDFSNMDVLVNNLLNTAQYDDFSLSGNVNLSASIFSLSNIELDAYVHINDDESVVAKVSTSKFTDLESTLYITGKRKMTIYLNDSNVKIEVTRYGLLGGVSEEKAKTITLNEFLGDPVEHLLHYGMGINIDDFTDSSTSTSSDIDLSKLLKSLTYHDDESWDIVLSLEEISSALSDVNINITSKDDEGTHRLYGLSLDTKLVSFISASLTASLDEVNVINSDLINEINNKLN